MRRRRFNARACAVGIAALLLAVSGYAAHYPRWGCDTAEAAHGYTTLAIRSANAYKYVLSTSEDHLVLVQYAMVEDLTVSPPPTPTPTPTPETPYGVSGAIIKVADSGGTVDAATPPIAGYALAAFYWETGSLDLTWGDATAEVCIEGSPTLFGTPPQHCLGITWNTEADHDATVAELTDDLPLIMLGVEQDDPDIDAGEYVTAGGITIQGSALVELVFPQLISVAPEAFQLSVSGIGTPVAIPTPGAHSQAIDAAGSSTRWAQDIQNFGETFGMPFRVAGLVSFLAICLGIGVMVWKFKGKPEVMLIWLGPLMIWSSLVGGIPFAVTVALVALVFIAGIGALITRLIPS